MNSKLFIVISVISVGLMSCSSPRAARNDVNEPKVKIGVYVDKGARSIGAFRWVEIATLMKNAEAQCIDAKAIQEGVLNNLDVIVMPGGRAHMEALSLDEKGRKNLKDFIYRGGGYIGTCAGCFLLMEPQEGLRKNYLGVIPYVCGRFGGYGDLKIKFNPKAEKVGISSELMQKIAYAGGPVALPIEKKRPEQSDLEIIATYDSNIVGVSKKSEKSFIGKGAIVAGTYGKGKVFASAVHPEVDPEDRNIIKAAFKYVSGKNLDWTFADIRSDRLSVGFVCDDSFGKDVGSLIQSLLRKGEFNLIPVNKKEIAKGALKKVDVLLIPDGTGAQNPAVGYFGKKKDNALEFIGRGGKIIAWGRGKALCENDGIKFESLDSLSKVEETLRKISVKK
jgi:glutamine amidotransferase-like uncharacterized protein